MLLVVNRLTCSTTLLPVHVLPTVPEALITLPSAEYGMGTKIRRAKWYAPLNWCLLAIQVDSHYFSALNMDYYLPNKDERTSTIDFDAVVSVDSTSDYNGTCY